MPQTLHWGGLSQSPGTEGLLHTRRSRAVVSFSPKNTTTSMCISIPKFLPNLCKLPFSSCLCNPVTIPCTSAGASRKVFLVTQTFLHRRTSCCNEVPMQINELKPTRFLLRGGDEGDNLSKAAVVMYWLYRGPNLPWTPNVVLRKR